LSVLTALSTSVKEKIMGPISVNVTDANNLTLQVTPTPTQTVTVDRGVAGNGIVSIVPVTISTFQYLRITYTNGTVSDVGPLTSTAYTATSPITIVGNTISLSTVPIATGGTGQTTANAAFNALAPTQTGNSGKYLTTDGSNTSWAVNPLGTVTSVAVSGGTTGLTTSGGPVTTSGTITLAGTLAIANGGSGQITAQLAINAFAGAVTSGSYLRGNGTNVLMATIQAADVPTLNQNTTGTAANVTGTVAIANGGTGQTTANAAFNALVPSQTSQSGKYLTTDGTNTSWATNPLGTVTSVAATVPSFLSITGSPITTSGTLAIGLSGTALPTANGGTGLTSYTAGDLPYYATGTALSKLGIGTNGQILTSSGSAPQWSTLSGVAVTTFSAGTTGLTPNTATSGAVTLAGTLATTNGGTGLTAFTANGVVYASSTSALATGSALTFDGTYFYTGGLRLRGLDTNNTIYQPTGAFNITSQDSYIGIKTLADVPLIFSVNSAEQMRLTSTGLVIGGTTAAYKLDVQSTDPTIRIKNTTAPTAGGNSTLLFECINNYSGTSQSFIKSIGAGNSGATQLTFGTSVSTDATATERARIDSAGNLGLGVTPSAWAGAPAVDIGSWAAIAGVSGTSAVAVTTNAYYNSGWKYKLGFGLKPALYQAVDGVHSWSTAAAGTAGNAITFTQAMTLDSSGNLGIGTSSPAYKLDVVGTSRYSKGLLIQGSSIDAFASQITIDQLNTTTSRIIAWGPDTATAGTLTFGNISSNATIGSTASMTLDSSGNLGLGVTPSAWANMFPAIQIGLYGSAIASWGTNRNLYALSNTYFNSVFKYSTTATASAAYYDVSGENGSHSWHTAGAAAAHTAGDTVSFTQAMTLDASGNLGIGTSSPAQKLQVNGTSPRILLSDTGTGAPLIDISSGGGSFYVGSDNSTGSVFSTSAYARLLWGIGAYPIIFATANTERARIDASGNLIQTVNTTAATLSTNGTMTISIVNNTTLKFSVRGSDGTTRSATLTLA
jgi:fibronectin-binding autotransporter adhesin